MELNTLSSFFNSDYMPHGHCYLWQPHILWVNVISDFFIAVAYFSLPVAIMLFSAKRKDIGHQNIFLLFSLFILFCGITHVIGIFTIWHGVYGIHGISKAATAAVSVLTAIYVYKLLPNLVLLPTPSQLKTVQGQLDEEVKQRSYLEDELNNQKLVNFVLNRIPVSTLVLNQDKQIIFSNQTFLSEFKRFDSQSLLNLKLDDIVNISFENKQELKKLINDSITAKRRLTMMATAKHSKEPIELCFEAAMYEEQLAIIATFKNLAEVSQIKSELVESHKSLERAISATEDGIWEWNITTNEVQYSPQLMKIIGKPDITKPSFEDWFSHIHDDYKDKVKLAIDNHFISQEKYVVEYLGLDKAHNYSWFVAIGDTVFNDDGSPAIMSGSLRNIDITKQLERKNQEHQELIEAIYQGSSQAIWLLEICNNGDFLFEQFNEAACKWTHVEPSQIIGKRLSELVDVVFPESVASQLKANYTLCATTQQKVDYVEELPLGGSSAWYKTTLYPIKNQRGEIAKIVGTAIDITKEQVLLEKLKESNSYLERFAFVASHDLQEPLRKIIAFADLLQDRLTELLAEDKDAQYEFSRLINAASRMRTIIDDILKLSRINSSNINITKCDVNAVIEEVKEVMSNKIEQSQAKISFVGEKVSLYADPNLMSLLLQNLLSNAIKFAQSTASPEILVTLKANADKVVLSCQDNGIGIANEFTQQIFEPFRRLHSLSEYEGSGIGLALCQQIMKVHNGQIQCTSTVGKGSCFTMTFPLTALEQIEV